MFILTEKMSSILYLKDKIMSEKRVCVPLVEKKTYTEMIVKGASRSTEFEDIDVADYILEKEEEEMLVEHFLALQLEENEAPARMDVQEQAPIQIIDEKSTRTPSLSDAPKNNSE